MLEGRQKISNVAQGMSNAQVKRHALNLVIRYSFVDILRFQVIV